jgi:hypothetical protein
MRRQRVMLVVHEQRQRLKFQSCEGAAQILAEPCQPPLGALSLRIPIGMQRPAGAREALGLSPLVEARGAYPLRRLLCWRERDQRNANNNERRYVAQQMSAFARILECLHRHDYGVNKA